MFFIVAVFILLCIIVDRIYFRNYFRCLGSCPSPPSYVPVLSHATHFTDMKSSEELIPRINNLFKEYGNIFQLAFLRDVVFVCGSYKDAQIVLSDKRLLSKGRSYTYLMPWIGTGLLTASGEKWKERRKMLTPAFHFNMMTDFLAVFNRNASILCDVLEEKAGQGLFSINEYLKKAALDNIYETAMGISKNIQTSDEVEYFKAVKESCEVIIRRIFSPHLSTSLFFRFSKYYEPFYNNIKYLHDHIRSIIKVKKEEKRIESLHCEGPADDEGRKKKFAFLDLLLRNAFENKINDEEMRGEVDTFLVAGFDTVTSAFSFTIYLLANHPEIQEKAYQEQLSIFGDSTREPTINEIQEMKYLEMVIKESQRLYPSIPIIERIVTETLTLSNGAKVYPGGYILLSIYTLHRDPEVWTDPETFNPENFSPEAILNRNPYAFVPFSAGPRNCIGQRFAMLELKNTISMLLRRFIFLPSDRPEHKLRLASEIVLVSKSGFHVQIQKRSKEI